MLLSSMIAFFWTEAIVQAVEHMQFLKVLVSRSDERFITCQLIVFSCIVVSKTEHAIPSPSTSQTFHCDFAPGISPDQCTEQDVKAGPISHFFSACVQCF